MKISFDIWAEDIIAFNGYYYDTDPTIRKQVRHARFMAPGFFLIAAFIMAVTFEGLYWLPLTLFGAVSVLWIIFWPGYSRKASAKRVRKEVVKPENALWFGRREMEFDNEKVHVTFDKGESTVLWSAFVKSAETDDHFFLFETQRQALVVPKRQITPVEVEELRSLFAKHIAVNTSEIKNKK